MYNGNNAARMIKRNDNGRSVCVMTYVLMTNDIIIILLNVLQCNGNNVLLWL